MKFVSSLANQTDRVRTGTYYRWSKIIGGSSNHPFWYWITPIAITILAGLLRFVHLGYPHKLIFDETYYVKDAYTLMQNGYESEWPADMSVEQRDTRFASGDTDFFTNKAEFLAHPPLGKYIIGLGIELFGVKNAFGWRFSVALLGTLAVFILTLLAIRLLHSSLLGGIAGFIFAIDNNAIVMSRVALLDNILMFFALAGLCLFMLDHNWYRRRLAKWVEERGKNLRRNKFGRYLVYGPVFWWRPWLIAGAIVIGMASAVKWSGIFFFFAIIPYIVISDWVARRQVGIKYRFQGTFYQSLVSGFSSIILAVVTYVFCWIHYFINGGWGVGYSNIPGNSWGGLLAWVPKRMQDFLYFQYSMLNFNANLTKHHPYESPPQAWPLMMRPTSMYWQQTQPANTPSGQQRVEVILGLPNPLMWWTAGLAFLILIALIIFRRNLRDWRLNFILMGVAGGYFPWLLYIHRTVFTFYVIAYEPFLILCLVALIGIVLRAQPRRPLIPMPVKVQRVSRVHKPNLDPRRAWGWAVGLYNSCFRPVSLATVPSLAGLKARVALEGRELPKNRQLFGAAAATLARLPGLRMPVIRLWLLLAFILAIIVVSIFILPISTAMNVPYLYWLHLMLFKMWI